MIIPEDVQYILNTLTASGFEAYAVGGCVRDSLLGRSPNDWDICTSALPEETEACFKTCRVIETGMRHGTVTVIFQGNPYEITTFRQDGDYLDHRRPEQVCFVTSLREDLSRRDFTIGAMAADRNGRIVDLFGGQEDLKKRCIRCVGDPERRFEEDALRILRGLRFASQLGFSIHPETARAMEEKKELLRCVSGERIYGEMTKLLMGPGAARVLEEYGTVLTAVFPEIAPTMGFLQHHPCHNRDVWGHTLEALSYAKPDPVIRWALLLHDLGKPKTFTLGEDGVGHFYGHPQESQIMAQEILSRLKADKKTCQRVCLLVRYHDYMTPVTEKHARRCILKFGLEEMELLLEVKRCDALAHAENEKSRERYEALMKMKDLVEQEKQKGICCRIGDLAIGGRELMELGGKKGPEMGRILHSLLLDVVDGFCENRPEALMARGKQYLSGALTVRKDQV